MAARRMTDGSAGAFHRPSDLSTYPALQLAGSKILDVEETAVNPDPPEHRRGPLWILRKDCLARVLERRHITGIAFSGTIGAGLFIYMSEIIGIVGSPGTMLAYFGTGFIVTGVMRSLAELVSVRPLPGALMDYPRTYVDPALGFAVGVSYAFAQCMSMAILTSAAARQADNFSPTGQLDTQSKCWIIIGLWVLTLASNICGVRWYGRFERVVKWFKMLLILGLCVLEIAIKAGVGRTDRPQPPHQTDFTFVEIFRPGGASAPADPNDGRSVGISGSGGKFLAMWTAMTVAMFPCMGGDLVVVTAGEARRPRLDLPKATQFMYLAPIILYIVSSLLVGLNINYADPGLWHPWLNASVLGSSSPFILTLNYTSIPVLPVVLNACFLVSAYTAGNTGLFVASRTLFSLAQDFGPPWMQRTVGRTSSNHTPIAAILLCSIFGLLTFLGVQNTGDASLNQPILTLSVFFTSTQGCVYISQCIAFLRFKHGLDRLEKDEIFSRDSELYKRRHYRAYWQPGWAWVGLIGCALIIFFSGWPAIYIMVARKDLSTGSLLKPNKLFAADLVGDYSGPIIFLALYLGYKFKNGTHVQHYMDFRDSYFMHEFDDDETEAGKAKQTGWWHNVKEVWSFIW